MCNESHANKEEAEEGAGSDSAPSSSPSKDKENSAGEKAGKEKEKEKEKDKDKEKDEAAEPGSLSEPGAHQAVAVLGIALIAMGEEIGAEMALRTFNHLVSVCVCVGEGGGEGCVC